jgi:hypothetical protein
MALSNADLPHVLSAVQALRKLIEDQPWIMSNSQVDTNTLVESLSDAAFEVRRAMCPAAARSPKTQYSDFRNPNWFEDPAPDVPHRIRAKLQELWQFLHIRLPWFVRGEHQSSAVADLMEVEDLLRREADKKADRLKKKLNTIPNNLDVLELARRIRKGRKQGQSNISVAREFAEGNEPKAQSLLRQLRRYPRLLD